MRSAVFFSSLINKYVDQSVLMSNQNKNNNRTQAYADQLNYFKHLRDLLVLHTRGIFWPWQLASLGKISQAEVIQTRYVSTKATYNVWVSQGSDARGPPSQMSESRKLRAALMRSRR
jgi:hypothetical protein